MLYGFLLIVILFMIYINKKSMNDQNYRKEGFKPIRKIYNNHMKKVKRGLNPYIEQINLWKDRIVDRYL